MRFIRFACVHSHFGANICINYAAVAYYIIIIINRNSRVPSFLAYKLLYFRRMVKSIISCNIFLYDLGLFLFAALLYFYISLSYSFAFAASFYAVALQLYALFIFPVFVSPTPSPSIVEIRLTYKHLMDWQSDLITFAIETT